MKEGTKKNIYILNSQNIKKPRPKSIILLFGLEEQERVGLSSLTLSQDGNRFTVDSLIWGFDCLHPTVSSQPPLTLVPGDTVSFFWP